MAEQTTKTIKTKILLRYDVLNNWTEANPELKKGEVAIVAIPTEDKALNVNGTTPPQILFKVGDGTSKFNDLPYASGKAADVYSWAKEAKLSIAKDGTGNVVSGIEWDATANGGKGGIKFTTASVATSESLEDVQDRLTAIEGTGEKSRITLLEEGLAATDKLIAESKAAWEKDDNTTYTFEATTKGFKVTPSVGDAQTFTFDYLTADEIATKIEAYGYKDEAGVKSIVESYGYKNEAGVKSIVEGYGYQTSAQVESAITSKGYQTSSDVESAITAKGYQTASDVKTLIANSTLAGTVADLSEDVATNAGDIKDLGDELDGHINNKENPHGVTAAQVGAYTKDETDALFAPYRTSADQDVIDQEIKDDIAGLKSSVSNLSGAFQFKGTVESVDKLPAASAGNAGHVYLVGELEYASNGTSWIQLGQNGDFVLDSLYQAHLTTQEAVDKGQSDKIAAIEKDIAENRAAWASKTSVTDPTSGDGKITVDGTEITVYDDSALAARVTKVENEFKEVDGVKGKVVAVEEKVNGVIADYLKGADKTELQGNIDKKQNIIDDLETIRSGAALGATAVQPDAIADMLTQTDAAKTYATKDEVSEAITNSHKHDNKAILDATTASFTTELKTKYDGYEGSISGVADRVTAVENEFKTVDGTKGKVVVLEEAVDALEGKIETLSVTETSVSYNGVTLNKYDDSALAGRVKAVEDNFADWAIIWDCGGASNN